MANSDETLLQNQQTIIQNQEAILKNQESIIGNQQGILSNQEGLRSNQEIIVKNQASIISNQKQIVDNQIALSVIAQSQAHILNLVKKLAGQEESLETTQQFLDKLKSEATEKTLTEPESL